MKKAQILLVGAAVLFSACGSQSFADQERTVTDALRAAIVSYNGAHLHDVATTGSECSAALKSLRDHTPLDPSTAPQAQRAEARAILRAYSLAVSGFSACAQAAGSQDFLGMARATTTLAQANGAIASAHRLDH